MSTGKKGKLVSTVRLCIVGGKATPAPPIGPALGSHISNIAAFCKEFNAGTSDMVGLYVTVDVFVFADRSYELKIIGVPTSELIRNKLGIKGSSKPNTVFAGKLSAADLNAIAVQKNAIIGAGDFDGTKRCVIGTAKSMGVEVAD